MTLIAFIITILVIVAIHEYGHFLTMRLFGVRVLTFSIGFGPKLLRWKSQRNGTDFVISAIPLGGYVKPLDRRDCEVQPEEAEQEFSGKPAWQRIIVYAAGPLANLLLALALYWVVLLNGSQGVAPVVGEVEVGSVAMQSGFQSGDEIVQVGDKPVSTWSQTHRALLHHLGSSNAVQIEVSRSGDQRVRLALPLHNWSEDPEQSVLDVLGMTAQPLPARLGELSPEGRAAQAGLQEDDRILKVDGKPVEGWGHWVELVQASPERSLQVQVARGGETVSVEVTPARAEREGREYGYVGVAVGGLRVIDYSAGQALAGAFARVYEQTDLILSSIGKMLVGDLSVKNLSGPVTIAQVAGQTASIGIFSFIMFLAFFSISLGVLNLLPIPMLDGGWIFFGLVEIIKGKPLSEKTLVAMQGVGMIVVFSLIGLALFNDFMRHFS